MAGCVGFCAGANVHRLLLSVLLAVAMAAGSALAQDSAGDAPKPKDLPEAPKALPGAPQAKGLPGSPILTSKFPGNGTPGIGPVDPRIRANQKEMPWRAVGRLKAGGGSCTGALVAPALLLTAAHCLYSGPEKRALQANELIFRLGYSEGTFDAEARGTKIIVPNTYDPVLAIGSMGDDWALIELDKPIGLPDRYLPMRDRAPDTGTEVALGGYARDRIEFLMVDPKCYTQGVMLDKSGMPLIRHNCTATYGVSGAPLLAHTETGWAIVGIEVVGGSRGGGASGLYNVIAAMNALPADKRR